MGFSAKFRRKFDSWVWQNLSFQNFVFTPLPSYWKVFWSKNETLHWPWILWVDIAGLCLARVSMFSVLASWVGSVCYTTVDSTVIKFWTVPRCQWLLLYLLLNFQLNSGRVVISDISYRLKICCLSKGWRHILCMLLCLLDFRWTILSDQFFLICLYWVEIRSMYCNENK